MALQRADPLSTTDQMLGASGSRIDQRHTVRPMREFIVYETELDTVSLLNVQASGFYAAASGTLFFGLGVIANYFMQETTSWGFAFTVLALPAATILTIGFALGGYQVSRRRTSILAKIKSESLDVPQSPVPDMLSEPPPTPDTRR